MIQRALFALAALAHAAMPVEAISGASQATNILFIFADDWGWGDLGCHGHPYLKTPNIDRLAREGTDFHRFTVASGVCSPSRAAVMTGQFPARHHIDGHFAGATSNAQRNMPDWLDPEAPLLSRFLQQGGYATAHFGKWHLSNNMIADSPLPSAYGFDRYGAFNCAGEQMPVHEDAQHATAFMEKSHREGKPFFVNVWLHEPHTPFHTQPKYRWRFPDLEERDNIYASVLSHADDRVGSLLATLDRLQITDQTLVIFSSDNGPARGAASSPLKLMHDTATGAGYNLAAARGITGGRKGYKASLYEGGIGVPFIARWPGKIAAGREDKTTLISAVDLLPTFCEIAGVSLPSSYSPDGLSQVDALLGKVTSSRKKPLFWKMGGRGPAPAVRSSHWVSWAIVDANWKLLADKNLNYVELYDLTADPFEATDLKESNPEVVRQLLEQVQAWQKSLPDAPGDHLFSSQR